MKQQIIIVLALCSALAGCSQAADSQRAERNEKSWVEPFTAPKLTPSPVSDEDDKKADGLIRSLKEISRPDFGLSPTLGGTDFPPVPDAAEVGCLLFTNHNLHRSDAVTRLVELGPHAVPSLLKHLSDETSTKLVVTHEGGFGGMWYARELPRNAASERERNAVTPAGSSKLKAGRSSSRPEQKGDDVRKHTVTIGDVCFVIIGMITNRGYQAVRYQPTACIVINSPTTTPELAEAVRGLWAPKDVREELYHHLLTDYYTRGPRSRLQCGAAMRLLYYFPRESAPLVAARIKSFTFKDDEAWQARMERNGVVESEFIKAVAWHNNPELRQAIRTLVIGSQDDGTVVSGTPAMVGAATDSFYGKLRGMLSKANRGYGYPSTGPQGLLRAIAALYPKRTAEAFKDYLGNGVRESQINLLSFMASTRTDLAPQVLSPLLTDRSSGLGSYLRDGGVKKERYKESDYQPMRMCDNAYELICRALGDKTTVCTGTVEEMDARIAALRERLASARKNMDFTPEEIKERVKDRNKAQMALEKEFETLGEEGYLLKHALPQDKSETWPDKKMIQTIAEKYPRSLPRLYQSLLRDCPHLYSDPVIELIDKSNLSRGDKIELLIEGAKHKNLEHRRAALFALHKLHYDGLTDLVIDALKSLPNTPDVPYWHCKAGPFAILVVESNDPRAWKVLTAEAKRVDVGTRMEMLNVMNYCNTVGQPLEPRVAFLAGFLDDSSTRDMDQAKADGGLYEGPCAGFTFPRLEVRDLAALELAFLFKLPVSADPSWKRSDWDKLRSVVNAKLAQYKYTARLENGNASTTTIEELDELPVGLKVVHDPNPARATRTGHSARRAKYTWWFTTNVSSTVGDVKIIEFGGFTWQDGKWVFANFNGTPFSSKDFAEWYSCPGALIKEGRSYADPTDWASANELTARKGRVYYIGIDSQGRRVKGEEIIEQKGEIDPKRPKDEE
jgi:hypothetical protein